jgi:hypothetical protein
MGRLSRRMWRRLLRGILGSFVLRFVRRGGEWLFLGGVLEMDNGRRRRGGWKKDINGMGLLLFWCYSVV